MGSTAAPGKANSEVPRLTQTVTLTGIQDWAAPDPPSVSPIKVALAKAFVRRAAMHCGLLLQFCDGTWSGDPLGPVMQINDYEALAARLAAYGEVGVGEAYMAGEWSSPDLVDLMKAIIRHIWTVVPRPVASIRRLTQRPNPDHEDNDLGGARRNISRHYDLSNDLFALFLDETMTYSSALFEGPGDSLALAQRRKVDRLLDGVGVGRGSRLLEIGTGWGELALRAAQRGARVTTITLSEHQASLARRRIAAAGLEHQVDVLVQDYRRVDGSYDAIVSIEMIEAVGRRWWPTYFEILDQRLAPGGRIGLQAILMEHDHMLDASRSWTWTRKYVFPGGVIPSQTAIEENLARHTTLAIVDRHRFGASYARTLQQWRLRFAEHGDLVEALGFGPVFRRMWEYYLAQSEAAFRVGYLDVGQFVLSRTARRAGRTSWPAT
jgi:cyclopropane-fatty-acyl-phospholipid synthase